MRHREHHVHARLAGRLSEDEPTADLCLACEQVHSGRHPRAAADAKFGDRGAIGCPGRDLGRILSAGEVGGRVAREQFHPRTRRSRWVERGREPVEQRQRGWIGAREAMHVVGRQLHALAHAREPDERHRTARRDERHGEYDRPCAACEGERADREDPERRM